MLFELLVLLIGIAFGFFHKGKEDFWGHLKTGGIIGIVLAIIFALLSFFFLSGALGLGLGMLGAIGIFIGVVILVIIFIVGAFIGNFLEAKLKK